MAAVPPPRTDPVLADLGDWLAAGPRPPLTRPRCVVVGPAPEALLGWTEPIGVRPESPDVPDATEPALQAGGAWSDRAVDGGTDLLVLAAPGVSEPVALAAVAAFTGEEPLAVLGFGGLPGRRSDEAWSEELVQVRDGLRRVELAADLTAALDALGDPALAFAAGALTRAVDRDTPVVLDGLGALTAALLVAHYDGLAADRLQIAATDPRPAAVAAARVLGRRPLLDLGPLPDGVAGTLTLPLLRAALALAATSAPE